MTLQNLNPFVQNCEPTSLRIVWQDLSAEAKGTHAVSIVVVAIIVVFVVFFWQLESVHFTF